MVRTIQCVALLSWAGLCGAQDVVAPVLIGPSNYVLPPAVDASGQTAVFGTIIPPASSDRGTMDLYMARIDSKSLRRLTQLQGSNFAIGATAVAESPDGSKSAYTSMIASNGKTSEEVHVVNTATLSDTKVGVDTEGCIQPLLPLCFGCFFPCLHTPHLSPDGAKVVYTSSRSQPFFIVNADGTNAARLPVYSGSLAPAAQRVISRNGLIVFTSSAIAAPAGMGALSPTDVYVMNLDGSNVRAITHFADNNIYARNAVITDDGSQVAFLSDLNGDLQTGLQNLFIVRTDGSLLRQLTSGIAGIASFSLSADGTRLAYIQGGQVYVLSTDGSSAPIAVTKLQRSAASDVVISDDGSRILCTVGPALFGTAALASIAPDGSNFQMIYAPRSISTNGIVGLGNFVAPSPGSFFTIYGINFAPDGLQTANAVPLPTSLGGISVTVNGQPVPVQAITPWQVNAQLPQSTPAGQAAIQLQFSDGTSINGTAQVQSAAPDIFFYYVPGPGITSGYDQAAAYHAGTAIPADMTHPAVAGETLEFYGTGLGATDPVVEAGNASGSNPVSKAIVLPQVLIGGVAAKVTFAGLTPGFVGLYQINAAVPAGLNSGAQHVVWVSGGNQGGGGVIWVQ